MCEYSPGLDVLVEFYRQIPGVASLVLHISCEARVAQCCTCLPA